MGERTLTGLCALLQENRLRQALAPYVLDGPHGRLLDAAGESLGEGDVQAFEMEQLLHARGAALTVLTYLFHRLEQRFEGSPTLLVLAAIGRQACRESEWQYGWISMVAAALKTKKTTQPTQPSNAH